MGGTHEGNAFASVQLSPDQLSPDKLKGRMTQVHATLTVAGQKDDTVSLQCIQSICYLRKGSVGAKEAGERGNGAIVGVIVAEEASYSLSLRARSKDAWSGRIQGPGAVTDRTAVWTPRHFHLDA